MIKSIQGYINKKKRQKKLKEIRNTLIISGGAIAILAVLVTLKVLKRKAKKKIKAKIKETVKGKVEERKIRDYDDEQ